MRKPGRAAPSGADAGGREKMKITLNGRPFEMADGATVADLLEAVPHPEVFALEADGAIIPAQARAATVLRNGSSVEIVRFVGGG